MKQLILFLLLLASGASLADSAAPDLLRQLRSQLGSVREEQLSVYQNYQMLKEQRRIEVLEGSPPMAQQPYGTTLDDPPPNYEDVLRTQLERENRIQQYTSELRRLSERFLELDVQKKALIKQITELEQEAE